MKFHAIQMIKLTIVVGLVIFVVACSTQTPPASTAGDIIFPNASLGPTESSQTVITPSSISVIHPSPTSGSKSFFAEAVPTIIELIPTPTLAATLEAPFTSTASTEASPNATSTLEPTLVTEFHVEASTASTSSVIPESTLLVRTIDTHVSYTTSSLSPNSKLLAICDYITIENQEKPIIRIINIDNFQEIRYNLNPGITNIDCLSFHPDNTNLFIVTHQSHDNFKTKRLVVINTDNGGSTELDIPLDKDLLEISAKGNFLIPVSYNKNTEDTTKIYHLANGKIIEVPSGIIAMSPDEKYLAYVNQDSSIQIISTDSNSTVRTLRFTLDENKATDINSLVFSPNSRYIGVTTGHPSFSGLGATVIWRTSDWAEVALTYPEGGSPIKLVFAKDADYFATVTTIKTASHYEAWPYTVGVWDIASREKKLLTGSFNREEDNALDVALDSTGTYAAIVYGDRSVRIWNITSQQVENMYNHDVVDDFILSEANYLSLTQDNKFVISDIDDRKIKISPWIK